MATQDLLALVALALLAAAGCGTEGSTPLPDGGEPPATDAGQAPTPDGGQDGGTPEGAGCGTEAAEALPIAVIAPRRTDEAIRSGDPDHVYVDASGPPSGRLFLFLPGATASPSDYQDILRHAAAEGDDALGLAYVNDVRIFQVCGQAMEPNCQENLRIEILRGEDRSDLLDVDEANSILNRLVKMLQHVGWTQYLDDTGEAPRWDRIAVGGHSQGSGHAAMIGRFFSVDRVLLFAGTEPAPWTLSPRATPPERTFGFAHTEDPLYNAFPRSWENFEIPGELTDVDEVAPPFNGSHQLITTAPANPNDDNAHRAPIGDTATPRDERGLPTYAPVWCHLLR